MSVIDLHYSNILPASIGDFPFYVLKGSTSGGVSGGTEVVLRKGSRARPQVGKKRAFRVEGFLNGEGAITQAQRMALALNETRDWLLTHPWLGRFRVQVDAYDIAFSEDQLLFATLTLSCSASQFDLRGETQVVPSTREVEQVVATALDSGVEQLDESEAATLATSLEGATPSEVFSGDVVPLIATPVVAQLQALNAILQASFAKALTLEQWQQFELQFSLALDLDELVTIMLDGVSVASSYLRVMGFTQPVVVDANVSVTAFTAAPLLQTVTIDEIYDKNPGFELGFLAGVLQP